MLRKIGMNVVFLCCVALLSVAAAINYPPLAGEQGLALDQIGGVELLSVPSADQGTSFTDSSAASKTVTNTETYDSYTKLMLHTEGSGNNFVDSAAGKTVTNNNAASAGSVL